MSWKKNNGRDRGHIDGIGHFLKGPNNSSGSGVSSVDSSGAYITVDPSGVNGVAVSLNLGLPDASGNILASDGSGNLYWTTDASGSGGEATGPANSVQMKNGATTDSIGYSNFIFDGQTFTIDSSNLKLDTTTVAIGQNAGETSQQTSAVAIGVNAGALSQKSYAVAIGYSAGYDQQANYAVAMGFESGQTGQESGAIAIGYGAGYSNQQISAVAMGYESGQSEQKEYAIAIGRSAGYSNQQTSAVAIGYAAGEANQQSNAVAIGNLAGQGNQRGNAVAIGNNAGNINQSSNAIAIGNGAGYDNQYENSIIINATGTNLNNTIASTCVIKPIRELAATEASNNVLMYDTATGEITVNSGGNKTFVIDHPTDSNKYLVHACLEGPEAGVYYRGTGMINDDCDYAEIILADYVKYLATDYTVNISPIYNEKENTIATLASTEVNHGKFKVYSNIKPCKFNYIVFGKREDIVVEPEKINVEVKGSGPYKWL